MTQFLNHYKCPDCGNEWCDTWDCMVDDECGECGAGDIGPYQSEDVGSVVDMCDLLLDVRDFLAARYYRADLLWSSSEARQLYGRVNKALELEHNEG